MRRLAAIEERHETKVHVDLLVTVEQRQPGGVRRELHFHDLIAVQHRDVLDHTTGRPPCNRDDLKTLSVQMDRVDVVRGVA
jgi:hypothetical protein